MKTKLFLFLIVVAMISCKGDEPKDFKIDPLATVNIKAAKGSQMRVKSSTDDNHLSALEIVKQTTIIQYNFKAVKWERVFESNQRDTISEIPCLKMYGLDIINQEGEYVPDFIESIDCLLIKFNLFAPYGAPRDTLAYIPNATLRAAEILIKQAYDNKDEALVAKTFNDAFTFIPISGAEYKALKAQGLQ